MQALADHANRQVVGIPVVQEAGVLIINGEVIELWGLDNLASDQQCWQDETAWGCGEASILALRHFVEGRTVSCDVQHEADDDGPVSARCFRINGTKQHDVAAHLVQNGWALERGETTGGIYFQLEQAAQEQKRGVWSGRFQTAQDWRDGVQRYVGAEQSPTAPALQKQ